MRGLGFGMVKGACGATSHLGFSVQSMSSPRKYVGKINLRGRNRRPPPDFGLGPGRVKPRNFQPALGHPLPPAALPLTSGANPLPQTAEEE
jgi:hypothetical protein